MLQLDPPHTVARPWCAAAHQTALRGLTHAMVSSGLAQLEELCVHTEVLSTRWGHLLLSAQLLPRLHSLHVVLLDSVRVWGGRRWQWQTM